MIRQAPLVLGFVVFGVACSSGAGSGTGGSGGGTGGSGGAAVAATQLAYKPCDQTKQVGGIAVELRRAMNGGAAFTAFTGGVKSGVNPEAVWQELAKDGDCRVMVGPKPCSTACPSGKVCGGSNMCVDEPLLQDTGTLTLAGLSDAVSLMWMAGQGYSGSLTKGPYPPAAPEVEITARTAGGTYPSFTLAGRGIEPLEFAGTGLEVARNQALPITWRASAKNRSTRIHIKLDIAHHGGISARIDCDVADTGSTTISAALVTKLMEQGLAGLPSISLTRQTADSTTIAPGCVDFVVASQQERDIEVEGVISCTTTEATCPPEDTGCKACPAGKTCQRDLQCK